MATRNSKMLAPVTAALLDSWEIPAEIRPVRCLPKAKSNVAASSSQGSTRRKVFGGVLMRSNAPSKPPTMLVAISGIITRLEMSRCLRYAPPLAVTPTHSASVLVALAATGPTPVNSSAGNAMKLPPPATALSAPPKTPAAKRKMPCARVKAALYHECAPSLHLTAGFVRRNGVLDNVRVYVYEHADSVPKQT